MRKMKNVLWIIMLLLSHMTGLFAQPEIFPWGNISGVRLDGELMELHTSLNLIGAEWQDVKQSNKEVGQYHYRRVKNAQMIKLDWENIAFNQSVEGLGAGQVNVRISIHNKLDSSIIGAFFKLELPSANYDLESLQLKDLHSETGEKIPEAPHEIERGIARGLAISGNYRELDIDVNEEVLVIVSQDKSSENSPVEIYFGLMTRHLEKGAEAFKSFFIHASGVPDLSPITLTLDPGIMGRPFKGFGGNFRLQNPESDPPVIDYCLTNMKVRWGRVEMPWRFWHPEEGEDPISKAQNGELHPHVKASMEMAARLHELGMPVILSDWSAPDWAIVGRRTWGPQPGGLRGNPLDESKTMQIYQSIGDYIQYVKDQYGFEFVMFSFNESDLGIYIRQTPEEHAKLIKGLGAYLKSRGIHTKLLLGDTADANGWPFLNAAMDDPSTHAYIGAVSFHSWRGYSDENLHRWAKAAERMNLPLLVGEGSMDAGAHRYPDIFKEPKYAMEEINLYVRILKICQPESILQWQLTADYSPMSGGGVFGEQNEPLSPTQRFWNFKQLADVPEGLFAMPVKADGKNLVCAALGDPSRGNYVIHIVNNGAYRELRLKGLPDEVRFMKLFITNERKSMSQSRSVRVRNGEASFFADSNSFITLRVDGESPF